MAEADRSAAEIRRTAANTIRFIEVSQSSRLPKTASVFAFLQIGNLDRLRESTLIAIKSGPKAQRDDERLLGHRFA